jgi:outer membrane protein assembly factor BamB
MKTHRGAAAFSRMRVGVAFCAALTLGGCATISEYMPSIPPPSFDWLRAMFGYDTKKPGPLPEINATVTPQVAWQVSVGKGALGFAPAVTSGAIYAAVPGGTIVRVDPTSGSTVWRIDAGAKLSAGVGADATLVVVGTNKGDVLAFDTNGKPLWQAKISSEVVGPPKVAEGTVVVWSGDGRTFGLAAADGKTKWVYQRVNPALVVRNYAGGVISRGGLFTGTAGGKLLAMDLATGNVGWEANVATPKGATELERIADVTSLPLVEERQVCAVAFQGRVACFEILRGTLNWSRDISSLTGLADDNRYVFTCDDASSMYAFDRATGASAWKQDKLAQRRLGGPQVAGDYLLAVDVEGYVHLFDRNNGSLVGRIPTDGTAATSQPVQSGANAVWQSFDGTLYAMTAR